MATGITYHGVKFSNNHCLLEAMEKAIQLIKRLYGKRFTCYRKKIVAIVLIVFL